MFIEGNNSYLLSDAMFHARFLLQFYFFNIFANPGMHSQIPKDKSEVKVLGTLGPIEEQETKEIS